MALNRTCRRWSGFAQGEGGGVTAEFPRVHSADLIVPR